MRRTFLGIILLVLALVAIGSLMAVPATAQTTGSGWIGTFWNNTSLTGTPIITNQPYSSCGLWFNWGEGPPRSDCPSLDAQGLPLPGQPLPGMNADNFSARFTSTQSFTAGVYTFTVLVNDGIRVSINGSPVLDRFNPAVNAANYDQHTFQYTVPTNQQLTFQVDYVDFTGPSILVFQWGAGTGGGAPTGPTATPIPPALGTIHTVRGNALRKGPYLGASMVGVVRPDIPFPILAKNFDEGLFPWYYIQDNHERRGWVSGRYLEVTGRIEDVPEVKDFVDQIYNSTDVPSALNVVGVTRSTMNIRRRPSQRTQLLGQVPWGDSVEVIGRTVQGGQNFWLHIRYHDGTSTITGWIFAPFVALRGVLDAVPIRDLNGVPIP